MKRGWFLLLAMSLGLNAGLLYMTLSGRGEPVPPASPGPGGPPPEAVNLDAERLINDHLRRMNAMLDLDNPQRENIRRGLIEYVPQILSHRRDLEEARRELAALFELEQLDPAAYRAATRKIRAAQAQLDSLVSEAIFREANQLDPGQRERYLKSMPWRPPAQAPPRGAHHRPPPPKPGP